MEKPTTNPSGVTGKERPISPDGEVKESLQHQLRSLVAAALKTGAPQKMRVALIIHELWCQDQDFDKLAEKLGKTPTQIESLILLAQSHPGELLLFEKILTGERVLLLEKIQLRDARIKEFREQGLSDAAIAWQLQTSPHQIRLSVSRLLRNCEIDRRKPGRRPK